MVLIQFGIFIALSVYCLFDEVNGNPVPPPEYKNGFPYEGRLKLIKRFFDPDFDPKDKLPTDPIVVKLTRKKRAIDLEKVGPPQTLPYDPDDGLKKKKRSVEQDPSDDRSSPSRDLQKRSSDDSKYFQEITR